MKRNTMGMNIKVEKRKLRRNMEVKNRSIVEKQKRLTKLTAGQKAVVEDTQACNYYASKSPYF